MSLSGLELVVFLFYLGQSFAAFDESFSQSDVYIIPHRAYICEDRPPAVDYFSDLRNINDDGDKALTMEFDFEDLELSDTWKINVVIDRWNNGDWDRDFYSEESSLCDILETWTPGAWKKFKQQVEPGISERCLIKPGHYKITDFEANQSDIVVPVAMLGIYRVAAIFLDETGEEIICQMAEVEIKKH